MYIHINNRKIDKTKILSLIQRQKKITAIKHIKEQLQIGLKDAKDIVDHLEKDATYYDGREHTFDKIPSERFQDSNPIKASQTLRNTKKQNLFIKRTQTGSKNYIILFLVICIFILIYLYLNK